MTRRACLSARVSVIHMPQGCSCGSNQSVVGIEHGSRDGPLVRRVQDNLVFRRIAMRRHRGIVVLALATLIAGLGCGDGGEARRPARSAANVEGRTTTTSAAITTTTSGASSSVPAATPVSAVRAPLRVDTPSAVVRVAAARCDREAACEHVGTGRAFGDRDECVNAIGHDVTAELPVEACPAGVDADRLSVCIAEIGTRSCDADTATVEASSCAPGRMCAQP